VTAPRSPDGQGHELGLGLDFGSTGLRAAFGRPGEPVRRFALSGTRWPWLLCEPSVTGPLPVAFPSLKSRLGSGRPVLVGGVPTAPEEVVTGLLRQVRERAEEEAGGRVTLTVVSVPVSYGSAQRTALLDAARAAGLDSVRLIGDAMAAVVGHTEGRGSTTCLVYGLGYGGFELGLVRGARGRYRALGHESASSTGGRAFDEAALTGMVRAARRRADPARLDVADWLRLRVRVERIREELRASEGAGGALLELDLGGGLPAQLQFDHEVLKEYLERHVRRTLHRADTLLDQSAMDRRDVDTLLLVGGGTRLEAVRSGVQGLGRDMVPASGDLLATGALLHASQLAGIPPSALEGLAVEPSDTSDDTLADAPHLSVTLLSPLPAAGPGVPLDVGLARRLAEDGRVAEARALLETILTQARGLLESLGAAGAPGPGMPGPAAPQGIGPGSARNPWPDEPATGPAGTPSASGSASPTDGDGVPAQGSATTGAAAGDAPSPGTTGSTTGYAGATPDSGGTGPTTRLTASAPGPAGTEPPPGASAAGPRPQTQGPADERGATNSGPGTTGATTAYPAPAPSPTAKNPTPATSATRPRPQTQGPADERGATASGAGTAGGPEAQGPVDEFEATASGPGTSGATAAYPVPVPRPAAKGTATESAGARSGMGGAESADGRGAASAASGMGSAAAEAATGAAAAAPDPEAVGDGIEAAADAPGSRPTESSPGSDEPTDTEHWADLKAVRRLTVARDLLTEGRYEEAVQTSHAAWQAAGDGTTGADVLDAMIAVHCAAAMADFSPEHFADAERWLRCAYGHDPTNARVRELLAERTFRHAERLAGRGRRDDAVEALHQCLTWNPEHQSAQALLERIGRRGRNHRDRGGVPR